MKNISIWEKPIENKKKKNANVQIDMTPLSLSANVIIECPHNKVKKKSRTRATSMNNEIFKGGVDFQNTEQTENREHTEGRIKPLLKKKMTTYDNNS